MAARVGIGLPLYQEGRFIDQTITSLLAQDYEDFELIIVDNASEDETASICEKYAAQEGRIKFEKNEENAGALANFRKVLDLCESEYFMWAGGHDLWSENYVTECINEMVEDPSVVLAYGRTVFIDGDKNPLNRSVSSLDTRGLPPVNRFNQVFWLNHGGPIYGLVRTNLLKQVFTDELRVAGDLVVLTRLALLGAFAYVPTAVWYRREVREETRAQKWKRYDGMLYKTDPPIKRWFPYGRLQFQLVKSIAVAKLGRLEKLRLFMCVPSISAKYLASMLEGVRMRLRG